MKDSEIKEILKTEDIYFACLMTLAMVENDPRFKITAELSYLLDNKSLTNVVKCLGGRTIRIPTEEELRNQLRTILLHQYYTLDGMDWKEAIQKAGFSISEGRKAAKNLKILENALDNNSIKFGGVSSAML